MRRTLIVRGVEQEVDFENEEALVNYEFDRHYIVSSIKALDNTILI